MITLLALIQFAFASSVTPGPNNMMLLASGANFGLRRTLPHMLGVSMGHAFMTLMVGLGLVRVFEAVPWLNTALTIVSAAYLLWLAWKIAHSAPPEDAEVGGKPFTFLQAAAFQWVNPKAIYMSITAQTAFRMEELGIWSAFVVALVFMGVNLPSVAIWAVLGTRLRRWLSDRKRLTIFNWVMAGLLVLSLVPILWETFGSGE